MSNPPVSTTDATPQKPPAAIQHGPARHSIDKFTAARMAKKKQKRLRHRTRLKRSNTGG